MKLFEIVNKEISLPYDVGFAQLGGGSPVLRSLTFREGEKVNSQIVPNKGNGVIVKLSATKQRSEFKAELNFDSEQEAKDAGF